LPGEGQNAVFGGGHQERIEAHMQSVSGEAEKHQTEQQQIAEGEEKNFG
jgi:hypothetical protein